MRKIFINPAAILRRDERGQIGIIMVLILPMMFLFFAMALDAGIWYFDHRLAQNQADAAALAAAQYLPAEVSSEQHHLALAAVDTWVTKNGSNPGELDCGDGRPSPEFMDLHPAANPDGKVDAVRVCVRRQSPGVFSRLADLEFIYVSAAATARVGPVGIANVKPWAIAPEDPFCNLSIADGGRICQADLNEDGIPEDCGFYPPIPVGHEQASLGLCPWGLHEERLQRFKVSSGAKYTPGNFAPIRACSGSGGNVYQDCISGDITSGFYEVGQQVWIEIETGNMVGPTKSGLDELYEHESVTLNGLLLADGKYEDIWECDVFSTPHPLTGMDRDGLERATATYVEGNGINRENPLTLVDEWYDYRRGCNQRLVSIAIIDHFPSGGGYALVLGVGTFGIASWDRKNPGALGNGDVDTKQICGQAKTVDKGGDGGFECGMVWGYFMKDAQPPSVLLNIIETDNPFAPLLIAMVE